jgi:hypothetical protein
MSDNDAAYEMSNAIARNTAENDFSQARGKAFWAQMTHLLDPNENKLISLNDVKELLKPKGETYKGMMQVPIKLIVGSEGRYRDFNRYFLPNSEYLKSRWIRVDEARIQDVILPPIRLYEIGEVYFVRDGNHRVSVAKSMGMEMIDAEVTSLSSEIVLSPDMSLDGMKAEVIEYEKRNFYAETLFGDITGFWDLNFSIPGQYDVIYNHILTHKYYKNQGIDEEIPFNEAVIGWYMAVYRPVVDVINAEHLQANFPGRTESDLYVWIVKHWDFLKQKYGAFSLEDAANDFREKHGEMKGKVLPFIIFVAERLLNRLKGHKK